MRVSRCFFLFTTPRGHCILSLRAGGCVLYAVHSSHPRCTVLCGEAGSDCYDSRLLLVNLRLDAQSDAYENLVRAGVIDPTKVVPTALQNADSIASLLLTTEALVSEIQEEKQEAAAGGGAPGSGRHDVTGSLAGNRRLKRARTLRPGYGSGSGVLSS